MKIDTDQNTNTEANAKKKNLTDAERLKKIKLKKKQKKIAARKKGGGKKHRRK